MPNVNVIRHFGPQSNPPSRLIEVSKKAAKFYGSALQVQYQIGGIWSRLASDDPVREAMRQKHDYGELKARNTPPQVNT
jgi:hypothetical protein